MKPQFIKDLIENILKDPNVKSIQITDWKECGEYNGEDTRPIINITKFDNIYEKI